MKPFWIQKHDFLCLKIIGMLYENRSQYEIYNEIRALMDFTTLDNIQKCDILESRGWITKNGRHIYIGDDGNGAGGGKAVFHTKDDPMVEVMGSAEKSHPKEIKKLEQHLKEMGVELERPDHEKLSYEPALFAGSPGKVCISKGASYSAWLHEVKHADDDHADWWLGMRVLADSKKCAKREIDAYQIEIDLALSLKRKDMAKRLEVLRDDEIKKYGY